MAWQGSGQRPTAWNAGPRQPRVTHNGGTIISLPINRRHVKRTPLNGVAIEAMAALLLDTLQRFTAASDAEAAVASIAQRHAEVVYEEATRLAEEIAWLNALIADGQGEGAPS